MKKNKVKIVLIVWNHLYLRNIVVKWKLSYSR